MRLHGNKEEGKAPGVMPGAKGGNVLNKVTATPERLDEMHNKEHMTYKQIADVFHCSSSSICYIFKKFNIPHRERGLRKGEFHHSEKTKELLRKKMTGRVFSEETIRKMSDSKKKLLANGWKGSRWNGGKRQHRSDGYIQIMRPDHPYCTKEGYVFEHRLVMEEKIGRLLKPEEVVHHINGIRTDNRPENLQLFQNGAEHQRYHALYTRKRNKRGFTS